MIALFSQLSMLVAVPSVKWPLPIKNVPLCKTRKKSPVTNRKTLRLMKNSMLYPSSSLPGGSVFFARPSPEVWPGTP